LPEVINNTNGLLVESENVPQLAAAMCSMMDNYAVYNRQAIAAGATQKYNYNAVAAQHYAVYNKILTAAQG
jgi:glycosyltransferase involved in cell wall biosynthesis